MSFAAAAARTSRKPTISRDEFQNQNITKDDVKDLRAKTTEIKSQIRRLKTQTAQTRQEQARRESAIKKVYGQTKDRQKLQTANQSTIQQLQRTIASLINIKEQRQKQLEQINKSDRFAEARELEYECIFLYDENERVSQEFKCMHSKEKEYTAAYNEAIASIKRVPDLKIEIENVRSQIPSMVEKAEAYRKGKSKSQATTTLMNLQNNPESYKEIQSEIQKQIESLKQSLECEQLAIKQTRENEKRSIEALSEIISDADSKILYALDNPDESNCWQQDENECEDDDEQSHEEDKSSSSSSSSSDSSAEIEEEEGSHEN